MKRLRGVMIVFTLILAISVVYAAATDGTFVLDGTVKISGVRLEVDDKTVATTDFSSVVGTAKTNGIDIVIDWDERDGNEVEFTFVVENTGSLDADFTVSVDLGAEVENGEIAVVCSLMSGTIDAKDSQTFTVTVTRDSDAIGDFTFTITISYTQGTP